MTVHFGTDHAGFELKNELVAFVRDELGLTVVDHGAHQYDEADDFPDFVVPAAREVVAKGNVRAIILGGSGQGEAMIANRIKGVRAAVYYGGSAEIIALSREHNDANVLSLGARFISADEAKKVVRDWLSLPFGEDARHQRRISKFDVV